MSDGWDGGWDGAGNDYGADVGVDVADATQGVADALGGVMDFAGGMPEMGQSQPGDLMVGPDGGVSVGPSVGNMGGVLDFSGGAPEVQSSPGSDLNVGLDGEVTIGPQGGTGGVLDFSNGAPPAGVSQPGNLTTTPTGGVAGPLSTLDPALLDRVLNARSGPTSLVGKTIEQPTITRANDYGKSIVERMVNGVPNGFLNYVTMLADYFGLNRVYGGPLADGDVPPGGGTRPNLAQAGGSGDNGGNPGAIGATLNPGGDEGVTGIATGEQPDSGTGNVGSQIGADAGGSGGGDEGTSNADPVLGSVASVARRLKTPYNWHQGFFYQPGTAPKAGAGA